MLNAVSTLVERGDDVVSHPSFQLYASSLILSTAAPSRTQYRVITDYVKTFGRTSPPRQRTEGVALSRSQRGSPQYCTVSFSSITLEVKCKRGTTSNQHINCGRCLQVPALPQKYSHFSLFFFILQSKG